MSPWSRPWYQDSEAAVTPPGLLLPDSQQGCSLASHTSEACLCCFSELPHPARPPRPSAAMRHPSDCLAGPTVGVVQPGTLSHSLSLDLNMCDNLHLAASCPPGFAHQHWGCQPLQQTRIRAAQGPWGRLCSCLSFSSAEQHPAPPFGQFKPEKGCPRLVPALPRRQEACSPGIRSPGLARQGIPSPGARWALQVFAWRNLDQRSY